MAALGNKGINFTYTDKLEDINTQNLSKYDALMIFANWDDITPTAEKALLDYVASGKGILPIHCASYCFRNSPEYVKMVGGQFWRHRMDTIQVNTMQPDHIIMKDLGTIRTFDETYLHSQLQADNNVLQTREIKADQTNDRPNAKTEPYTWTRSYGKGRVFYTAYGHDDNTWSNENFQKLLENGIIWAVNDEARAAHAALNPKPFEYKGAKLPNYEKRQGEQLQQLALTPEESMKHIQVPVDFTLNLFAAEPNVQHPIAMAWDERGRLYVLITKDYPNERKESGGSDYILICEDTNNDAKADKFTRFADGLSIPTGMVFANGGLIVSQAPHMIFLKDTNGDDKADEKKILFSGFGTGDTHAGPSNLHYGFDNWIWGSLGYSGFNGKVGMNSDSLKFGQALFRFKSDGSKLEWMTSTSNNTWGMGFNEAGDVFGSTANNSHGWYMAIPHNNFLNPGFNTDNGSRGTDTHKDMKPITTKVRQVDVFGGFTAAAGHNFYTARAFPKNYWNQIAFVAEPTGHILHQNLMVKKGSNYEDQESFNLMAGADEWFSPVFAEVGPDGAVWVADWYSYIIQHNPRPNGFKMGVGNAYETDLRDFTHGRIYRVGYKQAPDYHPISLSISQPDALLKALKNDNMFWRNHAQRLLVERGNTDVVPALIALVKDSSVDEIGLNTAAIHAIWTLKGLGAIEKNADAWQAIMGALKHPSWAVRKNALQVLPNNEGSVNAILQNDLLNDKEPLVILNSLLALNQLPLTTASEKAILARLENANESTDRWLPDALATALTSHNSILLKKYLKILTMKNNAMDMPHNHLVMQPSQDAKKVEASKISETQSTQNAPDLIITNFRTEPSLPFVREGMRYFVEVKNIGKDSLKNGQVASLKIDITGVGQKSTVWSQVHTMGIAPNETVTISKNTNGPWSGDFGFSTDLAGDYTFSLMTDYENKVAESNEKNNSFIKKITFQQPQKASTFALERAVRSYASIAPADSVIALLKMWDKLPNIENATLLKGLSNGWNTKRKVSLSVDNQAFMASLSKKMTDDNLIRINKLMQAWNLKNSTSEAEKDAIIINIKTIMEAMKYDKKTFTVQAGKTVIIVLENPDAMQHNLVIGKQKSLQIIGNAANKMITQRDAVEKNYVPAIPQIIAATPLVNPGETYRLKFTAPTQIGDYPYVCTFPGHWSIMNGIMKVVK